MVRSAASIVAGAVLALGTASAAAKDFNQLVKGDYVFTGEATCLVSEDGFNPDLTPVGPPNRWPRVFSFSVQGVRTFNGDGTGSVRAKVALIAHPFALPATPNSPVFFSRGGAGTAELSNTFKYTVNPDLEVTIDTDPVNGRALDGSRAGQTFQITDIPQFRGLVSHNLRSMTLSHEVFQPEHHSFSNGDSDYRLCHRSRVFLELKNR